MQINSAVAKGMLSSITDPKLREVYGNILDGSYPYVVFCENPQKKGKTLAHKKGILIGYLDSNLKAYDEATIKDGEPIAGLLTSRDRLDGRKGFKCYCGNDSIVAPEEDGIMNRSRIPVPPSQEDLTTVLSNVQKSGKTPGIPFVNGRAEYDGFAVEEVKK